MGLSAAAYAGIVTAVSAVASTSKQVNNQIEADAAYAEAATQATLDTYEQITKSEQASAYNAGQDTIAAQVDALNARATATTTAAASGQAGQSVSNQLQDIDRQKRQAQHGINMKQQDELNQTNAQARQAQRSGTTQSNVYKPSAAGYALQGATVGASTYGAVKQ